MLTNGSTMMSKLVLVIAPTATDVMLPLVDGPAPLGVSTMLSELIMFLPPKLGVTVM